MQNQEMAARTKVTLLMKAFHHPHGSQQAFLDRLDTMLVRWFPQWAAVGKLLFHTLSAQFLTVCSSTKTCE
jgi:hypothetical protein